LKNRIQHLIQLYPPKAIAIICALLALGFVVSNNSLRSYLRLNALSFSMQLILTIILFVCAAGYILYLSLHRIAHVPKLAELRSPTHLIISRIPYMLAVFTALLLIAPLINYTILHWYEPKIRLTTMDSLSGIAKTKVLEINLWIEARKNHAQALATDANFADLVEQFHNNKKSSTLSQIAKRLDTLIDIYDLSNISLLNGNYQPELVRGNISAYSADIAQALLQQSSASAQLASSPLYLNATGELVVDVAAPIFAKTAFNPTSKHNKPPIAFIVMHLNLSKQALPSILTWPTSSQNVQSLLVHKGGEQIVLLGAQNLATPITPPVPSIYGSPRIQLAGLGQNGQLVYAAQQAINSDWSFFAQISQNEVNAPLRVLLLWISGITLLATTGICLILVFLWKHQVRNHELEIHRKNSEQDQLLKRFFELPFIGMGICDPISQRWLQANARLCEIFGYSEQALKQLSLLELTHPDDSKRIELVWQSILKGEQTQHILQKRFIHHTGKTIMAKIEIQTTRETNSQVDLLLIAVEDLTELKLAEFALKQSEERLSLAFKGSQDGWWDYDLIHHSCYQSLSWWNLLGYVHPLREGDRNIWQELTHPDDFAKTKQFIRDVIQSSQTTYQLECRLRHRDGHYVPILTRGFISRNQDGQAVRISGTDTDITEQLASAHTLKLQEQFNRALLENQTDAVIACDAQGKLVLFNHVARSWHGVDALNTPVAEWPNYFCLYDMASQRALLEYETPLARAFKGERLSSEVMAIKAQNQALRYVSCSASSFFDSGGNKLGAVVIMRDVSELLEHEKSLQASEAIYREMFDANPNPMWVIDANSEEFLAINDATVNHYGWSRDEFSRMSMHDIRVEEVLSPVHANQEYSGLHLFQPIEFKHYKKDGSIIDIEITSNPLQFGTRQARLVMVTDVTDRKLVDNEIRTVNRLLLMLTNINQTIVRRLSPAEMFQEACTVAVRDGGFRMAWIGLINPQSNQLEIRAVAGYSGNYLEKLMLLMQQEHGECPTLTALTTGEHAICHNLMTDPQASRIKELSLANGYRSMVALPITVNGQVVGNFSLYSSEVGSFNQREMDLLDELANDIAFALAVGEVELERSMTEKALRESETLFHTLARSSPVGVFHTDAEGDFLYINQSWFEITGISLEESMANGWLNGLYEQDKENISAAWLNTVREKLPFNQEFRFKHPDGSVVWVKGQAAVEQDATGQFLGFVGTVTDITALKQSEERLLMSNAVFENTREGIMVTDAQNQIIMVNRACSDITQYQAHELIGKMPNSISSGRHDRLFYADMWNTLLSTDHWQGELWNRRKNGDIYPELLSISAIKNEAGEITNYVGVFADISNLKSSEEKLEFLAHHDPLTKLPNRLMLLSRLDHAIESAKRDGSQLALLMLDLDRFKNVNDSFGHLAGDELLQKVAQRLTSKLRSVDTVTRLGGDEFTVLLEDIASTEDATRVAMGIIKALEASWTLSNNVEVRIGASVGISVYPGQGDSALELLQHADAALYQAKAAGRGCVRHFSERLTQVARNRFNIESRLRMAIQNKELRVFYQPKIDIISGQVVGAEALMRWYDPVEGMMLPTQFINIAEETGLIRSLGEWVIRETCLQGKRWIDQGMVPLKLAVNISAHQLHHSNIVKILDDLLNETGFPRNCLELELTESILMNRETEVVETLNHIRAQGITLAIDDFGTGYSSLSYLKSFPLDVLKIDKSFVADIEHDPDDRAITATIIKIAHTLGMHVVAEGVETETQLEFLKSYDCDMYQGHLSCEAISAEDFTRYLLEH
jgi:diguanylate cyclase (GGDEF)-like protein/PAS domain S-box-containing protein